MDHLNLIHHSMVFLMLEWTHKSLTDVVLHDPVVADCYVCVRLNLFDNDYSGLAKSSCRQFSMNSQPQLLSLNRGRDYAILTHYCTSMTYDV